MKLIRISLLFALILPFFQALSVNAYADSLVYAGVDIGYAEKGSSDSQSLGFHVGTGLIPFIAFEGGYRDFGSFGNKDCSSYYLAAKPSVSLGGFQLYILGGFDMYDIDRSVGGSDDGVDLMYGLGADYFFTDNFSIGASYTKFGFESNDVDSYSVAATFHFL